MGIQSPTIQHLFFEELFDSVVVATVYNRNQRLALFCHTISLKTSLSFPSFQLGLAKSNVPSEQIKISKGGGVLANSS